MRIPSWFKRVRHTHGEPRDADFWRRFMTTAWQRTPVAFPGVAAEIELAGRQEVFEMLLALVARLERGDERIELRINRSSIPVADALRYAPREQDGSNEGYLARMRTLLAGDDLGIIVNDFQALSPDVWQRVHAFLNGLYTEVGLPSGGAIVDLFMGDYKKTPLGLHKDSQDVFTFVVEGRKTALLWPFERLQELVKAPASSLHTPFVVGGFDYEPYRKEAIILTGRPGDLLYWPASYWHVIEGDGSLVTTLSLGLFLHDDPVARLGAVRDESGAVSVEPPSPILSGVRRVFDQAALQDALEERLLSRRTSYGFKQAPDPMAEVALSKRTRVRLREPCPISWMKRADGTLTWACDGELHVAAPLGLAAALRTLCDDKEVSIQRLYTMATVHDAPVIAVEQLLATLLARRAIEVA